MILSIRMTPEADTFLSELVGGIEAANDDTVHVEVTLGVFTDDNEYGEFLYFRDYKVGKV